MRGGLSRYWTSGPRGRAASLALLSGHESGLRAFVAEYLSVLGESAASVLGGTPPPSAAGGRRAALTGLARTAYDQLGRTASLVYAEMIRRGDPAPEGPARPHGPRAQRGSLRDTDANA